MNNVERINDAISAVCVTVLGVTWVQMRKLFQPVQNDLRIAEKSFAVRPLGADPFTGAQVAFVFNQQFEIILSRRATNRDNDVEIQDVIFDLYDKADNIFRSAIRLRASLDTIILDIDEPGMAEPEVLDNGAVILRFSFRVKHWLDKVPV